MPSSLQGGQALSTSGWGWDLVFTKQLHALGQTSLFQLSTSSSTSALQTVKPYTFMSLHICFVSFNSYLLSTYDVPGTVLGTWIEQ